MTHNDSAQYLDLRKKIVNSMDANKVQRLEKLARIIRALIFATVEASQSGHPGGSSSKVEQCLGMIFSNKMAFDYLDPKNVGRDRVVWSAGHCTPLLHSSQALMYECLRKNKNKFKKSQLNAVLPEDLINFRKINGPQGHAESTYPFSDISTGPSGHGLPAAGGLAISHRGVGLNTKVWCFMGDAESEEGISYEARNVLAKVGVSNLIVSLDYNHFGIDGPIEEIIDSPYINHWLGLGWNLIEVDGHNIEQCIEAYRKAHQGFFNDRPTVILAHTIKGKDYGSTENTAISHGKPADHDEYVEVVQKLGFNIEGKLGRVDQDIQMIIQSLNKGDLAFIFNQLLKNASRIKKEKDLLSTMQQRMQRVKLRDSLKIKCPKKMPKEFIFEEGSKIATRKACGIWVKWMMEKSDFIYTGTGDLSGSISIKEAEDVHGLITKKNAFGRAIRFGIAEPNLAMMSTALTHDILPGNFRPISIFGSYAVFSTMMANCIRLAVIGNDICPEKKGFFILLASHDGPETGEDGPTHQGLYWMSFYSALPGIKVYKPFDANETIEMLFYALKKGEPIALSLMRPKTPVLKRENGVPAAKEAVNGAYVYKKFKNNGKKKRVLAISGVQVLLNTLEILPQLEKKLDIKIVAVTSPELFFDLEKSSPKKASLIISTKEKRMVITIHNGWKGFLDNFIVSDDRDRRIGIDSYLKSGCAVDLYKLAGLSPDDLKKKILACKF